MSPFAGRGRNTQGCLVSLDDPEIVAGSNNLRPAIVILPFTNSFIVCEASHLEAR
jgi:hypothetical protein